MATPVIAEFPEINLLFRAEVCAVFEVDGLRADIVTARTAVGAYRLRRTAVGAYRSR